jgi:hypothetical protein
MPTTSRRKLAVSMFVVDSIASYDGWNKLMEKGCMGTIGLT